MRAAAFPNRDVRLLMSKPAARLTDMHVCPMITVLVPHVGGPVAFPGEPRVLIGGLPAARVGDFCICVGPPDVIVLGSFTVLIGGKPAARMGDLTAHGGAIVGGFPQVMIGDVGGASGAPGSGMGAGTPAAFTMQAARAGGAAFTRTTCNAEAVLGELKDSPLLVTATETSVGDSPHWIEIELVDQNGKPVPYERYRLKPPGDAKEREGFLDANGFARITGILGGMCTICFPSLDADAWQPVQGDPGRRQQRQEPKPPSIGPVALRVGEGPKPPSIGPVKLEVGAPPPVPSIGPVKLVVAGDPIPPTIGPVTLQVSAQSTARPSISAVQLVVSKGS